jgi:hypothetical protein
MSLCWENNIRLHSKPKAAVHTEFLPTGPLRRRRRRRSRGEGKRSGRKLRNNEGHIFIMAQKTLVGQGLLIIEASRSHSDTPHSVGLLWTSNRPDAETSTWKHTTLTRDLHAPGGIRTHNPSKRAAADPQLRQDVSLPCQQSKSHPSKPSQDASWAMLSHSRD